MNLVYRNTFLTPKFFYQKYAFTVPWLVVLRAIILGLVDRKVLWMDPSLMVDKRLSGGLYLPPFTIVYLLCLL